ncbi:ABC transporter ATP-binding protein [Alicyclobacillus mali (ex Roth et al. 2021)]|uniref:ABC transporter ATP-binding protein n=1 Tax=Alicyclobacillus mali (ex Roth et al. 2021) TaxID=1123961 RepID=UPI000829FE74|nr:ABC transporter ATP-binding protein [Alicyclobacillus mali (ex Roth et al. 2021)]
MLNSPSNVSTRPKDAAQMRPPALAWRGLSVSPPGASKPVLRDVSGEIARGRIVAFVGPNGAGKTTFFRALVGLARFQGEIDVHGRPWREARWRVQMGFQPPAASFVGQTVEEELAVAIAARAAHLGHPAPDRRALQSEIHEWLQTVGLRVQPDRPVDALSGGEMAKLAVAGALASGADVLLMDETQAELDPDARSAMRAVFRRLAQTGRTVLLVTHDMDDVLAADAIVVVKGGAMREPMSPRAFFYGRDGHAPCDDLGFAAPYLVQAARRIREATGADFAPLTEDEFVEGWRRAVAGEIGDSRARKGADSVEHLV